MEPVSGPKSYTPGFHSHCQTRLMSCATQEPNLPTARRKSDISFFERRYRSLTLRRTVSEDLPDAIGPLGLNLLHQPSESYVDFVFVHGLRGGSRKTWSATPSEAHFWPKAWLPNDPDFKNVRIHSFGYNSDWADRRENPLSVHDFGQSLIEDLQSCPEIRREKDTRIVFIGHSMGGLVIKKACIISRENPLFQDIGQRIHSIYFLATPHRGSNLAQTLQNVLRSTLSGSKSFVSNLERGSEAINTLNDQFRHHCKNFAIHSFTESMPMNWGIGSGLVVDQQSATLGLAHPF
jgi:PGAP1-like protein